MNRKYRRTVIAGNWKMNKTPSETKEFMTALKGMLPRGSIPFRAVINSLVSLGVLFIFQLPAITVLRYFLFINDTPLLC